MGFKYSKKSFKQRAIEVTFTFIPSYGKDLEDDELLKVYKDQLTHGIMSSIEYLNVGDKFKYSSRVTLCSELMDKHDEYK